MPGLFLIVNRPVLAASASKDTIMSSFRTMPLTRQQRRAAARRARRDQRQASPVILSHRPDGVADGDEVKVIMAVAEATLVEREHGRGDLQPGTSAHACCQAHQVENAVGAIHRVRRRLTPDYDSKQCDVSLRAALQHWSACSPIAIMTLKQLAVYLAADHVGFSLGGRRFGGEAQQTLFNGGEYVIAFDTLGEEELSPTASLNLATANLLSPFAVQQLAGGHLSASPARFHAASYFLGHGHHPSDGPTATFVERQLTACQRVCTLLDLYEELIVEVASILLSSHPQAGARIDQLTSRITPPRTKDGARFLRHSRDLLASLAGLPAIPPVGGGTVQ